MDTDKYEQEITKSVERKSTIAAVLAVVGLLVLLALFFITGRGFEREYYRDLLKDDFQAKEIKK